LGFLIVCSNRHLVTAQSTTQDCNVSSSQIAQSDGEKNLLQLINNYRSQNGLPALSWSSSLSQAAAWMSNDMNANNYFSHTDSAGRNPGTRIKQCGYNWTSYAENIFPNSTEPQDAFDAWKNSPPHNANMLNASYREAGIGLVGNYWTLDLGSVSSSNTVPTITTVPTVFPPTSAPLTPPSSTSTPSPTPSIILNPIDTKVHVSVRLAGIGQGGNKSPKHLTRQVVIAVFNLENRPVIAGNGFLKYNGKDAFEGTIHLGQVANGTYYIKIASANTLVSLVLPQFQTIHYDKQNSLPTIFLTQGDIDQNNVIDIDDYNLALPCFQRRACGGYTAIDINDDGSVDVIDYNLFLSSFKRYEGD
jgi:hypothetical protein